MANPEREKGFFNGTGKLPMLSASAKFPKRIVTPFQWFVRDVSFILQDI